MAGKDLKVRLAEEEAEGANLQPWARQQSISWYQVRCTFLLPDATSDTDAHRPTAGSRQIGRFEDLSCGEDGLKLTTS